MIFMGYWNIHERISCVYKITNIINKKVYIGQTNNLRSRYSDYNTDRYFNDENIRPIYKAIKEDGADNFIMEIERICNSPDELGIFEAYYIEKYHSTDPKFGYNVSKGGTVFSDEGRLKSSIAHIGLTQSNDTKRKRSNTIYAIGDLPVKFIICDSGKLFGDYIGKGKDMIKNGLREPSAIKGYYLYYSNFNKRIEIYNKLLTKRSVRNKTYIDYMTLLNKLEIESVETIYKTIVCNIGEIYELKYEYIDDNGLPFIKKLSFEEFKSK